MTHFTLRGLAEACQAHTIVQISPSRSLLSPQGRQLKREPLLPALSRPELVPWLGGWYMWSWATQLALAVGACLAHPVMLFSPPTHANQAICIDRASASTS